MTPMLVFHYGKGINNAILYIISCIFTFSQFHLGVMPSYGVVNVEIPLHLLALSCSVCTLVSLWLLGPMLTPSITPVPVMLWAQQDMAVDRCAHIIALVLSAPSLFHIVCAHTVCCAVYNILQLLTVKSAKMLGLLLLLKNVREHNTDCRGIRGIWNEWWFLTYIPIKQPWLLLYYVRNIKTKAKGFVIKRNFCLTLFSRYWVPWVWARKGCAEIFVAWQYVYFSLLWQECESSFTSTFKEMQKERA